jgi:hypothetical protein
VIIIGDNITDITGSPLIGLSCFQSIMENTSMPPKKAFDPLTHLKMMSMTAMYPSDHCPNSLINRTSSVISINIASGDL